MTNGFSGGSAAFWQVGADITTSVGPIIEIELFQPFLTKNTVLKGFNAAFGVNNIQEITGGIAYSTLSSTGFTFTTSTGTITGGTLSVYGYKK